MDDEREANQAEPEVARPGPIVSASPVVWPSESLPADESQAPAGWASAAPVNRPGVIVVGPGLVLAGIGTRIAAVLVDGFILSGAAITITGASAGLTADRNVSYVVAAFVSAILAVGYFAVGWLSPWAATPGQRLAGLRVLDAATLDRIDVGRAILRSLLLGAALNIVSFAAPVSRLFGAVLIVWPFVLITSMMFHDRRQGFHDRWARTIVVRPVDAGSMPLTIGCFAIVLIVLAAPLFIAASAGPALQQLLDQLPARVQQP